MIQKIFLKCHVQHKHSFVKVVKQELRKDKIGIISIAFITFIVLIIVSSMLFFQESEILTFNAMRINQPPSSQHLLGTDGWGRDVIKILTFATRNTLAVGILTTVFSCLLGVTVGLISGYLGGKVDNLMMRVIETLSILPNLIILIVFASLTSEFSIFRFTMILSLLGWMGVAKVVRTKVLKEKELEYIQASKSIGTPTHRIIFEQLLPNVSTVIISSVILIFVGAVAMEASLSFLGFGFPRDIPSLGSALAVARSTAVVVYRRWVWLPHIFVLASLIYAMNNVGRLLNRCADARQWRS